MKIKKGNSVFLIEYTDLFGGELNYSFKYVYRIQARTYLGAVRKFSKYMDLKFRIYYTSADHSIYHSSSKLSGFTIEELDLDSSYGFDFYAEEV